MKNIFVLLSLVFIVSCYSVKFKNTDTDSSITFYKDDKGRVFLSSMNSAQKTVITKFKYVGDTLVILEYKRSAFYNADNLLPLKNDSKYLKCANQLFKIKKNENGFNVVEIQ